MVELSDEPLNEYSFVNAVCDDMDPADVLLSLVLECPHDARRKSCPIDEIAKWRKMRIRDARDAINSLPHTTRKELVEKHRCCSCSLTKKCPALNK
jgi:hypothetical protein